MATKTKSKKSSVTKKSVTKKSAAKKGARKAKRGEVNEHNLYTLRMPLELREALNARAAELTASRGSRVTAATVLREIVAKSLKVSLAG